MKRTFFWIALTVAVLFCFNAAAQPDFEAVAQQMAEDGASEEQIEEWLQHLSGTTVCINTAKHGELEQCGLFTPFQIVSLLEYREEYGSILSAAELSLVDGFSPDKVAALLPFITMSTEPVRQRGLQYAVRSRYKYKVGNEGLSQYNRLIAQDAVKEVCLLAESDAGEKILTDHLSASLRLKKGRWQVVAGDYLACFGQGLAMWKGFSFSGLGAPSSLIRRGRGIVCNHTADENGFLRGAACTYSVGGSALTLFASANGVDANVGEKGYTSIVSTGYHRTDSEMMKKDAMHEYVAGADYSHAGRNAVWGMTAVAYSYDRPNARKVQDYNKYQMYNGWHGNLAANGLWSVGHTRLFAELAVDSHLAPAALAGVVFSPSYRFEAALHLRYYDRRYIATHAGSYSSATSISNQRGAVLNILYRPGKVLQLTSLSSVVHYPWLRYHVDGPSTDIRQKTRAEWKCDAGGVSLQHNFNYSTSDGIVKHNLKLNGKLQAGCLGFALRSDAVTLLSSDADKGSGFAVAGDVSFKGVQRKIRATCGITYYNADSYDSRVYIYENELPGGFSSHFFYGKGVACRLMAQYRPAEWIDISSKISKSTVWEAGLQMDLLF